MSGGYFHIADMKKISFLSQTGRVDHRWGLMCDKQHRIKLDYIMGSSFKW